MASIDLYTKYRRLGPSDQIQIQREHANEVLTELWNEVCDPSRKLYDIEFIAVIKKMIEKAKFYRIIDESSIFVLDAFAFVNGLLNCTNYNCFMESAIAENSLQYLFSPVQLDNEPRINFLNNININLNSIEKQIKAGSIKREKNQTDRIADDCNGSKGNEQTIVKSDDELKAEEIVENPDDYVGDYQQEKELYEEKNNVDFSRNESALAGDKCSPDGSKSDTRIVLNRVFVDEWHNQIDNIGNTLKTLQPDLTKMLESIINFSDNVTEKFVLQFARMEIELYNSISDNYEYHKGISENSGNQDYINSVENCGEYMMMIVDSLAVFGIEEVKSSLGDSFNGKYHESESTSFSSRSSFIKKSIRSGFKYKDIILQKEKVEV